MNGYEGKGAEKDDDDQLEEERLSDWLQVLATLSLSCGSRSKGNIKLAAFIEVIKYNKLFIYIASYLSAQRSYASE